MLTTRVIPVLLLRGSGLYKTQRFKKPKYVGDPLVALKIFNEKEVDEIVVLDTTASIEGRGPNFPLIEGMASECFMPLAYGGGITSVEQMSKLFYLGIEKVVINTSAAATPQLIAHAADRFGSQSVVVSIDVSTKMFRGKTVYVEGGRLNTRLPPVEFAQRAEELGAGEIILNSIDRDGMMQGYDLEMLRSVVDAVNVPVVALGGAGEMVHFQQAVDQAGVSAVAAGSMFVFQGPHRAVLINMPERQQLEKTLSSNR
jgi:cyclase